MFTFKKSERITSLKEIDTLFERGRNSAVQAFPLRAIYQMFRAEPAEAHPGSIRVLISVAKKRLHHAVDRNRAKRQIREAYRLQHQPLTSTLTQLSTPTQSAGLRIAFVWQSDKPVQTSKVFEAMKHILDTIEQKIQS